MKRCILFFAAVLISAATLVNPVSGQNTPQKQVKIANLTLDMPDFTLPALQGGEYSISGLKGKNILLVFPRGRVQDSVSWCNICQYQYAELVNLVQKENILKKYNLEILFVLPYDKATLTDWVSTMPKQLAEIEEWKHPKDTAGMTVPQKGWMNLSRQLYPESFSYTEGKVPTPIPILIDAGRTVSKGLGLFTTEWDRSKVDQNIPTIYIVDKNGKLQFKYVSQRTIDRPNARYLLKFIEQNLMK